MVNQAAAKTSNRLNTATWPKARSSQAVCSEGNTFKLWACNGINALTSNQQAVLSRAPMAE